MREEIPLELTLQMGRYVTRLILMRIAFKYCADPCHREPVKSGAQLIVQSTCSLSPRKHSRTCRSLTQTSLASSDTSNALRWALY